MMRVECRTCKHQGNENSRTAECIGCIHNPNLPDKYEPIPGVNVMYEDRLLARMEYLLKPIGGCPDGRYCTYGDIAFSECEQFRKRIEEMRKCEIAEGWE